MCGLMFGTECPKPGIVDLSENDPYRRKCGLLSDRETRDLSSVDASLGRLYHGDKGVDRPDEVSRADHKEKLQRKRFLSITHKLERKVTHMENEEMEFEEGTAEKTKAWIQENLRVIVSVFIVAAIALGIYSYSDRSLPSDESMIAEEEIISSETTGAEETGTEEERTMTETGAETAPTTVAPTETSRETAGSFVETASPGDGLTHLARKATANYLEKNPDSSLTAEHKIYIEDYLRKAVSHKGGVKIGTSVEFQKDLIGQAIAQSKTLSERQLKNLEQYSSRVAEFRK